MMMMIAILGWLLTMSIIALEHVYFSFTVTAGMAIETKAIVKGRKAKRRSLLVKYIF